jgi:KaiC/GvpD/RAD55 family RecA-like ATPase
MAQPGEPSAPCYAQAAPAYWASGWRGILPLPHGVKWPPPKGWTGTDGPEPSWPDVTSWSETRPDGNVALRMPDGVVGIDVDDYGDKDGWATLTEAVERWGRLDPTVRSTSRTDGRSGIYLFRVPPGTRLAAQLGFPADGARAALGHVEIVQRHHRYAVVAPSTHPEGGQYRWVADDDLDEPGTWAVPGACDGMLTWHGTAGMLVPELDEIPYLPDEWVTQLEVHDELAHADAAGQHVDVGAHLQAMPVGAADLHVTDRLSKALVDLTSTVGSRHDTTTAHVLALLRQAEQGHPGVPEALGILGDAFVMAITTGAGARSTPEAARAEYARMVTNQRGHQLIASSPTTTLETLAGLPPAGGHPRELAAAREGDTHLADDATNGISDAPAPATPTGIPADGDASNTTEDTDTVSTGNLGTSWAPVDLGPILAGSHTPEVPAQLQREDGHRLLYAGRINGLIGESESGKSWVAMHACCQAMLGGESVLFIDHEDTAAGVVGRFRALGIPDELLAGLLTYLNPDESLGAMQRADLVLTMANAAPTLIVVDGVNAAMSAMGLDLDKNKDATLYYQQVLKALSSQGATVVTIDHVTKNKDGRGGYAIGAQAKRAMTDGAIIEVEAVAKFGRGQNGKIRLRVSKDRMGEVRAISGGDGWLGDLDLTSDVNGDVTMVLSGIPTVEDAEPNRPYVVMEKITNLLHTTRGAMTTRGIREGIPSRASTVDEALGLLVAEGYVERTAGGPRGALAYTLVRQYFGLLSELSGEAQGPE